jgi:hypothetical protein
MDDENKIQLIKLKFGFFSKFLLVIFSIFYLATFVNKNFFIVFSNIPFFSIFKFEIFRLITGNFISENILDLFLNISITITILNYYENIQGTIKTMIKFWTNVLVFQIIILVVYSLLGNIFALILSFTIKPFTSFGVSLSIRHILSSDKKIFPTMMNIIINDRFLFLFILILGFVCNIRELKLDFLFSIYYGFLMCKFPKFLDYCPSEEDILHIEKNEKYKFLFNTDGWITVEECYFKSPSFALNGLNVIDANEDLADPEAIDSDRHSNKPSENVESLDLSDINDPNLVITDRTSKLEEEDFVLELTSN